MPIDKKDNPIADFLDDIHDMRRVENRFSCCCQSSQYIFEDHDTVCVNPAQWLIKKQYIRIMQKTRDDQNLLPHPFGNRRNTRRANGARMNFLDKRVSPTGWLLRSHHI